MVLQFTLNMPGRNTWNGEWSGDEKLFAVTRTISKTDAEKILQRSNYGYDFGDGWRADVSVKRITAAERMKVKRKSAGFCGYEWMVASILKHKEITA
jgi:hypothetical protein